jgi:hypothetical protein
LFVALGGTSYAVATGSIGSREIRNNSVRGKDIRNRTIGHRDVKRNGLGGSNIKESRLGRVPRAKNSARLGGVTLPELRVHCPGGTRLVADACVEGAPRAAQPYGSAAGVCRGVFRRLATMEEENGMLAFPDVRLTPGGELTGSVVAPSSSDPQHVRALVVTNSAGAVTTVPDTNAGSKPFRCALDPTNAPPQ